MSKDENEYKDAGTLNGHDMRAWRKWWEEMPGCSVRVEKLRSGLFRCYLKLYGKPNLHLTP